MKKLLLLALILGLALGTSAFFACASGDDDDDDDDDAADDTFPDDDDDDDTDDTDDDDDDTDDDDATGAPVLSDGMWDPDTFTWDAANDCSTTPCTALVWSVCDTENNIGGGGMVYVYNAGTTDLAFGEAIAWEDFFSDGIPDVSDCTAPAQTGINVTFQAPTEAGDYYSEVDMEATDADGNISNKLTNIRVEFTYAP